MSGTARTPRGRPYRGASPEERDASRRDRLVAAATDVFATTGYAGSSVDAICGAAGVSKRHFYELFANREALLIAVYDQVIVGSQRALSTALASVPERATASTFAEAGITGFLGYLLEDPRRARINFVEVVGASPAVEAHRRRKIDEFRAQIIAIETLLIERGQLAPREPAVLRVQAAVIIGALQEATTDWLATDVTERASLDLMVQTLVGIVERATQ